MKVEIITSSADPDHGGFGARVHGLISMYSRFADVRVVMTDGIDRAKVPGVEYMRIPVSDSVGTRLRRLRTYYRVDFPRRASEGAPDLVVAESLDLLGLHQYGPHVPMILDEHNVYWNLLRYDLVNAPFFSGWLGRRAVVRRRLMPKLLARAKEFEIRAIQRASRTLVTSDDDRRAILTECPDAATKLEVLPNCVDVQRFPRLPEAVSSRNVLFVGGFNYVPNREAAQFICRSLAPRLPEARFLLVGPGPPPEHDGPNVVVTGHVPDLVETLREARVCIAPLFHGSGTRIKILTYLAASRPVVATPKACEGLPVRDGRHLLIRESPDEFRDAIHDLMEDSDARKRLAAHGRELVETMFDWRGYIHRLRRLSEEVIAEDGRGEAAPARV